MGISLELVEVVKSREVKVKYLILKKAGWFPSAQVRALDLSKLSPAQVRALECEILKPCTSSGIESEKLKPCTSSGIGFE